MTYNPPNPGAVRRMALFDALTPRQRALARATSEPIAPATVKQIEAALNAGQTVALHSEGRQIVFRPDVPHEQPSR